jgi:Ca2+/Na+ antiporter
MDIEKLFNRRFDEKIKEQESKMFPNRMEYDNVKDPNYLDSIVLVLIGIIATLVLYFNSFTILTCVVSFSFYICFVILYYTERARKCKTCKSKMRRFENNDDVLFCCDKCKTKFKCIIRLGNDG